MYIEFYITNFLYIYIKKEIMLYGKLSFSDYMYLCLYTYKFGYYDNSLGKFGFSGDFITAPEVGKIFSMCLTRQLQQILFYMGNCYIIEIGAGTGALCRDVVVELDRLGVLYTSYIIIEKSYMLKKVQKQTLKDYIKKYKIFWVNKLHFSLSGVFILNEVIDALPVDCYSFYNGFIYERSVVVKDNFFTFSDSKPTEYLKTIVNDTRHFYKNKIRYEMEININIKNLLRELYNITNLGCFIFFDYGHSNDIYYADIRKKGTLTCHRKHVMHTNPFCNFGIQDMTTHVNFSYMQVAAVNLGYNIVGYITLASFLYNCDLLNVLILLTQHKSIDHKISYELNILISPSNMGDIFKVLILTKHLKLKLNCFNLIT